MSAIDPTTARDLAAGGMVSFAAAEREFGIGRDRLSGWVAEGLVPHVSFGGKILVPRSAITDVLASHMRRGKSGTRDRGVSDRQPEVITG